MTVLLRLLLILAQLTGIYGISEISQVSVKAGDSVTVPCPYQWKDKNHVKYLCKGDSWGSCTYAVKTNTPDRSGRFSISDDKSGIFTVTIRDLTVEDTHFWCTVEIDNGLDHGRNFHLAVTKGTPSLHVDRQKIKGHFGDDITIRCYHGSSREMQWCMLGRGCVTGPRGKIDGREVTINSTIPGVSIVTMSKVTRASVGWYACVQGDLQMPVHVTLTQRPVTTTSAPSLTTASGSGQTAEHSSSDLLMNLVIPLSLLVVVVMVTLFIWFILKKQRTSHSQSSATATSDTDVMYSSVVVRKPQAAQEQAKAQDEDLTYSTLAWS